MITKEQFLKVIDAEIQGSKCIDKLCEMHIDIIESPLFNSWGIIRDEFFDSHFTEEGAATIGWWLYEDGRDWTREDGSAISVNTPEELWDALVEFDYIKK